MKYIAIAFLVTSISFSQRISKQIIGSAGTTQSNLSLKVSWTIGEPIVGLMTAGDNQLGNGYYPTLNLQALSVEDNVLDLQLRVFPNPTSKSIYVMHPDMNSFGITIVDLNGKQLYSGTINKDEPLDVSNYSKGMFLVTVENRETNKKNTYKIIKK